MNKQRGFSIILFPIIILIIGAVGFAGWYVWSENYSNDANKIDTITAKPQFCGQQVWTSQNRYELRCTIVVGFDEPYPEISMVEEIIKPIKGEIGSSETRTSVESLQVNTTEGYSDRKADSETQRDYYGIYYIKVELGQEESAIEYLQNLPGVTYARQFSASLISID